MAADAVAAASQAVGQVAQAAGDVVSGASSLPPTGFGLVLAKLEWLIVVPGFYLAFAFLVVGVVVRLVRIYASPPPPYQLAIYPAPKSTLGAAFRDAFGMPTILKREPLFWVNLVAFHLGIVGIILGHLDILPGISILPESSRHMVGAGVCGLLVTLPVFWFLGRRFRSEVRIISTPGDYLLLLLLLFTFLLGDLMSWGNSWTTQGFVMTKAGFARYFEGLYLFRFEDPRAYLHGTHYHFLVLHLLLAELTFIVLPFSKVMHAFLSIPSNVFRRRLWKPS